MPSDRWKALFGVAAVDDEVALGRPPVALDLLRPDGVEAQVDGKVPQHRVVVHEVHRPAVLVDEDARDLGAVVGLELAGAAAAREDRADGDEKYRSE
jgi:hypothetical protein